MKGAFEGAISSIKGVWNTFAKWLNKKLSIDIPKIEIAGKTLFGGKKINFGKIPTFATGGFPEDGWFRASKGEYFGQFDDGTSYIATNKQIENGIAAEIAPAVHAAVKAGIREVFSEMPMQGTGDVYLDGVKVTKEVMSTAKKISKSRGSGWKLA